MKIHHSHLNQCELCITVQKINTIIEDTQTITRSLCLKKSLYLYLFNFIQNFVYIYVGFSGFPSLMLKKLPHVVTISVKKYQLPGQSLRTNMNESDNTTEQKRSTAASWDW